MLKYFVARAQSFGFAIQGARWLVFTQPHARIHLVAALLVVSLGAWLGVSRTDWALLTLAIGGVWGAEALNTATEMAIDIASPEYRPMAGHAKDVAATSVLLVSIAAAIVGGLVFLPFLLR